MAPKRKKSRSQLEGTAAQATDKKDAQTTTSNPNAATSGNESAPSTQATQQNSTLAKPSPTTGRSSWSWRSKASPIAQIAHESISVAQGATSESSEAARPPNSVSKSVRGSRKSIPLVAEATKVHATSEVGRPRIASSGNATGRKEDDKVETKELVVEEAPLPPEPTVPADGGKTVDISARGSWFGWWSRPDGYASDGEKPKTKKPKLDGAIEEVASSTPLPGTPIDERVNVGMENTSNLDGGSGGTQNQHEEMTQPVTTPQVSSRSWFGLWSTTQNQDVASTQSATNTQGNNVPEVIVSAEPSKVEEAVAASAAPTSDEKTETESKPKSAGWAFWSSDKPKDQAPTPGGTQKQIGELAVADTPSQSSPEAAQFNEQRKDPKDEPKHAEPQLRSKRGRASKIKDSSGESSTAVSSPMEQSPAPSHVPTPSGTPPPTNTTQSSRKGKASPLRPNLILPSFKDTFPAAQNPGYIDRLTQYLAQSLHIPGSQPTSTPQHVSISSAPPKVKNAVAIGVHGFFPGALIQRVLGQPTGTSIRFANHAAASIKTWCEEHQPNVKDVEIEKVALEGEGYIADRVATLWKLLLNWVTHLRNADFILIACHSQGVPVAIMLVAKLIQLGCLSASARVGICAMAGINLGPFLEYKSRLFGGSALELFEFCDSESQVSKAYADSLEICLRHGVRITYVGSIDDQLVSLESSLHAPLSHPYVARAVFIDGRLHAPNFLTHLVVFTLKLRNLGVSDHGLLRELSGPLAGSLVGGEGHSRIYDDANVYRLAMEFALESTDAPATSADVEKSSRDAPVQHRLSHEGPASSALESFVRRGSQATASTTAPAGIAPRIASYQTPPSSANGNPFYLPWAVRGVLEEEIVKRDPKLREEVEVLVREFEEWKPTSKVLKDVRWRLEGVRSMH